VSRASILSDSPFPSQLLLLLGWQHGPCEVEQAICQPHAGGEPKAGHATTKPSLRLFGCRCARLTGRSR
jgi:hypothetical protein